MSTASLVALSGVGCVNSAVSEAVSNQVSILDYGRSFVSNTGKSNGNAVRMWIESKTTIIDERAGIATEYYQGGSCKSEDTFAEKGLFYEDNYDFLPVFGDGKVLVFRRHAEVRQDRYKTVASMADMWGENPTILLHKPTDVVLLDTWEKIARATSVGLPIVTQTEISDNQSGLKAIIECPCKTMNVSSSRKMYQTDTGPIILPDLSERYAPQISCFQLAYIAFNVDHFADFVIEVPTAIVKGGEEVASVHHYSKVISMPAKNTLYAIGKLN